MQEEGPIIFPMKVVLLGQSCVGKSSLVLRFVQERFFPNTEGTIGAAFLTKSIFLDEQSQVKFEIWDTAGQERYHSLAPMYYRGAQAAIVAFDITSRDSYDKAKVWVNELHEKSSSDQLVALVGNKLDLRDSRAIDNEEAEKYASEKSLFYFETSAKDGTNVDNLFLTLATKLPKISPTSTQKPNTRINIQNDNALNTCRC